MAKKEDTGFDPVAWQTSAPATKEEKKQKRHAEKKVDGKQKISNRPPKSKNEKVDLSKLKYGIFVGACVLAVGGTGLWAWTSSNANAKQNSELLAAAKTEVEQAKKKEEVAQEKKYSVTKKDYKENVKLMVKGIKTLSKKENGDLSGYFVSNEKYYNIVSYDRETGQLYVIETNEKGTKDNLEQGRPIVLEKEWVNTLLVRLEAENS